jgi:hypothetical protein
MNSSKYIELDWKVPLNLAFGEPIHIPVNTVLWKAYDSAHPPISNRPTYFTSKAIANRYVHGSVDTVSAFITTRSITVIDFNAMKSLLMRIIQMHETDEYIDDFAPLILSFGLCSLGHQIDMIKKSSIPVPETMEVYYSPDSIIEQRGVRFIDIVQNGHSMAFLREFFRYGTISGFIYLDENQHINPELIIFDPNYSGIVHIPNYPSAARLNATVLSGKETRSITDCLNEKRPYFIWNRDKKYSVELRSGQHPLDEYDSLVRTNKIYEKIIKAAGQEWHSKALIFKDTTVTFEVSPWTDYNPEDFRRNLDIPLDLAYNIPSIDLPPRYK